MKTINQSKTLAQEAFIILRQAILNNELQPDQLYSATELGVKLGGISRTPVREAAQMLEKAGMVRIEKNRGIRVLSASLTQLIETFQIRLMLEVPLARQAALLRNAEQLAHLQTVFKQFHQAALSESVEHTLAADRDYHLAILAIVSNSKANQIISECRNTVLLTGKATIPTSRSCLATYQDHIELHQAIEAQNGEAAATAMRNHILNTAQLLVHQESAQRENWHGIDVIKQLQAY